MTQNDHSHYEKHISEAMNQLKLGRKPSADSVLKVVKGSKATAVAAMNYFWSHHLPEVCRNPLTHELPDTIYQSTAHLWETATQLATNRANLELEQQSEKLKKDRLEIEKKQEQLNELHKEMRREVAEIRLAERANTDRMIRYQRWRSAKEISKLTTGIVSANSLAVTLQIRLEEQSIKAFEAIGAERDLRRQIDFFEATIARLEAENSALRNDLKTFSVQTKDASEIIDHLLEIIEAIHSNKNGWREGQL